MSWQSPSDSQLYAQGIDYGTTGLAPGWESLFEVLNLLWLPLAGSGQADSPLPSHTWTMTPFKCTAGVHQERSGWRWLLKGPGEPAVMVMVMGSLFLGLAWLSKALVWPALVGRRASVTLEM